MKLLLREHVPGLGAPGDVVEAKDGYGRNYLLPQRLAVANTARNRALLEAEKVHKAQREAERVERAKEVHKGLRNALLQTHQKAQKDGSLYGSVTTGTIAEVVKTSRGFVIEERWIQLENPIRKIGDYDIKLRLPNDLEVTFKLTVLPEGE
jgi:large subunit ribosomal protein L9